MEIDTSFYPYTETVLGLTPLSLSHCTHAHVHTHTHTQTLDLLFKMTNPLNVVVISDRLIEYLRQTTDEYIQSDLVAKITQLAERFAPNNQWFLQTMNAIFEHG